MLAALGAAMVLVNWRGLFSVILVGGALLTGNDKPSAVRRWFALLVVAAVSTITFVAAEHFLERRAEIIRKEGLTELERNKAELALKRHSARLPEHLAIGPDEALRRVGEAGAWFSLLLWPPATAGNRWPAAKLAVNLVGWALIALFLSRLLKAVGQRQRIWFATAGYAVVLIAIRWYPLPRYLAPAAPLILLGLWDGCEQWYRACPHRRLNRLVKAFALAGFASVASCNLAILGVQAWMIHAAHFHVRCLGGEYRDLLRISRHLTEQAECDAPAAVVTRYADVNRSAEGNWAERALTFISACEFLQAPKSIKSASGPGFLDWAERRHVKYVVSRPEKLETRFWHFREPLFGRGTEGSGHPFYLLSRIVDGSLVHVPLPEVEGGIRRVPGL